MSYVRFGSGGSDVYVYPNTDGYLVCASCWLTPDAEDASDWHTPTQGPVFVRWDPVRPKPVAAYIEMLAHLDRHIAAKHHVPELALSRLRRELNEAREYEMEQ